ncbi:unnamed protein product [Coregonus sp. 'balchen']|nr:unnamed protein product [Coregonus sp. 'balchen']
MVLVFPSSSSSHAGPIAHLSLKRNTRKAPALLGLPAPVTVENGNSGPGPVVRRSCEFGSGGSELVWQQPPLEKQEKNSAPPDVTSYTTDSIQVERPQGSTTASRATPKYGNAELMETGDGECSIQQPDPNQPKAEGAQMLAMRGEQLGVVTNWPPSLEAALQRWGTISPKAPCLTTMDTNGKPLYILTYGKLWLRSMKVAYNILHKLGSKQEPMVRPGDRVSTWGGGGVIDNGGREEGMDGGGER